MRVSEVLKRDALSLSFEVFPPKTTSAFESVKAATEEIAALRPAFVSVTYGAGGGTSQYTLEIARNIRERYGVPTIAHLTCVSSTRELVRERIEAMKAAGIAYATDQIIDLFANGIKTVHVYTMNTPDVAAKILNNLSDILG